MNDFLDQSAKRFDTEFVNFHPGDSGMGGNDPQEPVYELSIDPQSVRDIRELKAFLRSEQLAYAREILNRICSSDDDTEVADKAMRLLAEVAALQDTPNEPQK